MVNVGATRFRGRCVALPAGRSVSAMLTSDDGDVRAYVVATLGWPKYVVLEAAARRRCAPPRVGRRPAVRCKRFVELAVSGLASMYPASDWSSFAPGHHGYQRACVLISGQASIGPFGSPVFACARKTEPPSRLILSQTSAGNC